jgi:perosamine synthetase
MSKGFIPVCEPLLEGNELKYVTEAVNTGWISSTGEYVKKFEDQFAEYCGAKYAIAVTNGTVALHLAIEALGIGEGDEVIIPNFTMFASAAAVCYTGAMPVFVDADKETWNIDVTKIEEKITSKTKAIMAVHLFGLMSDMENIHEIAKKYELYVIEDAAEAHGAALNNKKAGSYSDISAFSFYANKNLTTGEGGMVVTDNDELYKKSLYYKNLCFKLDGPRDFIHNDIGYNYRMSNLHAAIGLAQVEKADYYKQKRIENGILYRKYLRNIPGIYFQEFPADYECVYWMNALYIDPEEYGRSLNELLEVLNNARIGTRLLFAGMHKQPSLQNFGCDCKGEYPVSENLYNNGFYLPSSSSLTGDDIEKISSIIINNKK